ncbi:basic proline-rich protein-like [Choloepus didactylus]|uniref:basic proline-rich protein-like n=1 Tax=Choloepus didactylus TaxID=27675 RepID=UPI00189E1EB2|nr:basic proline-rich protein-like [Choloepus didactylus]
MVLLRCGSKGLDDPRRCGHALNSPKLNEASHRPSLRWSPQAAPAILAVFLQSSAGASNRQRTEAAGEGRKCGRPGLRPPRGPCRRLRLSRIPPTERSRTSAEQSVDQATLRRLHSGNVRPGTGRPLDAEPEGRRIRNQKAVGLSPPSQCSGLSAAQAVVPPVIWVRGSGVRAVGVWIAFGSPAVRPAGPWPDAKRVATAREPMNSARGRSGQGRGSPPLLSRSRVWTRGSTGTSGLRAPEGARPPSPPSQGPGAQRGCPGTRMRWLLGHTPGGRESPWPPPGVGPGRRRPAARDRIPDAGGGPRDFRESRGARDAGICGDRPRSSPGLCGQRWPRSPSRGMGRAEPLEQRPRTEKALSPGPSCPYLWGGWPLWGSVGGGGCTRRGRGDGGACPQHRGLPGSGKAVNSCSARPGSRGTGGPAHGRSTSQPARGSRHLPTTPPPPPPWPPVPVSPGKMVN